MTCRKGLMNEEDKADTHIFSNWYLVPFQVIDVGEVSEPFRVSSRSLPNSITWDIIRYFGCSCAYVITFFIKLCETPPYYEPSGLPRWHNLIAVCNEAAAKKGGVSL